MIVVKISLGGLTPSPLKADKSVLEQRDFKTSDKVAIRDKIIVFSSRFYPIGA